MLQSFMDITLIRRWHIRYWLRFRRYRGWRDIFIQAGWDPKAARQQAWRQSRWYDPRTGRSVLLMESLERPRNGRSISKT